MNNGTIDLTAPERTNGRPRTNDAPDELAKLKHELLRAEVRLAKARASVVGAEIDIKMLNVRLKNLTQ